jgi:LysM repeat protein
MTPEQYIEKYKLIAIQERFDYGVPAAITLAQGILESGVGNGRLAREANNHFGIKCHSDWTGKRIYKDDDAKDECFRVYDKAEDSYRDHSLFLAKKSRYEFLFKYKITDYKAWAKGLKKAGYATNPKYPKLLIDLVERYDLVQYDKIGEKEYEKMLVVAGVVAATPIAKETEKPKKVVTETVVVPEKPSIVDHSILYHNNIKSIIVHEGESISDIANIYDIYPSQLYKYNDMAKGTPLKVGMRLYLQPKHRKGNVKYHLVREGESLWQISQQHGIKMKWIKKRNHITKAADFKVGQKLYLRSTKKLD